MEDKLKPKEEQCFTEEPVPRTKEELLEGKYQTALRDRLICRARASVMRSQVVRAYEIIDNIRLTQGLSDTVLRDKITRTKKNLEMTLSDFLLSDKYHEDGLNKLYKMTPKEYEESLHSPDALGKDVPCKK